MTSAAALGFIHRCLSPASPALRGSLAAALALACGTREAPAPSSAAEAPAAEASAAESSAAESSAAATSGAAGAPGPGVGAPATPRPLPAFCAGVSDAPLPGPGVRPTKVKGGFVFVEGPVWSAARGAFFFSEMDFNRMGKNGPPSKIHQLILPSSLEVFIPDSGSNGLAIDEQGLVACTHDTQTLSRYDLATRARSVFVADYQGKHFNSPNDVALAASGNAYFSDPDWQIGERPKEIGVTGVYLRTPGGEVRLLDGSLDKPNGVSLSPDETTLYVGHHGGAVEAYPLLADGGVGPRRVFAQVDEPDGMAVDCLGRLYVASHNAGKVIVLSPEGQALGTIEVAPRLTNLAFGGADRRTLLMTAGDAIYTLQVATPGFPY